MTIVANGPLKSARSRAWGGRVLGWWIGELAACIRDLRRIAAIHSRRSITIEVGERYWLLRRGARPIGQIDTQGGEAAELRRLLSTAGKRHAVVVEIPPERALAKTIALPAGAKGQLDRILGFEIARHFPFPAERVYFQHRLVKGAGDGAMVEIVAVPREIVDAIGAALAEAGLRPAAIAVHGADATPLYLGVAALGGLNRETPPTTRLLGFAAGLTALAALASWPFAQQAELDALDREIDGLKPRAETALRAGEAVRSAGERSAAILALRAGRPPLVAALDQLSRDLPDGAWLLSLSISGRDVVLDGLAPSAAAIALALEKSHDVSGIVFRSPITREASGLEHFQLGATLSTPGSAPGNARGSPAAPASGSEAKQ
jgi:general secretion pathway protein L